jgi:hypothetical protein
VGAKKWTQVGRLTDLRRAAPTCRQLLILGSSGRGLERRLKIQPLQQSNQFCRKYWKKQEQQISVHKRFSQKAEIAGIGGSAVQKQYIFCGKN